MENVVKPWAREKHARLRRYVDISRAVRKQFLPPQGNGGATYIDLYCGLVRAPIEGLNETEEASSIVAFRESKAKDTPYSEVVISDLAADRVSACRDELRKLGATVTDYFGPAEEIALRVTSRLNPAGLHFAFLDPYNLEALPFGVIEALAVLKRMDILIHVSVQDLQRNLRRYMDSQACPLDTFAPGWRNVVDRMQRDSVIRHRILDHWRSLIKNTGLTTVEGAEEIVRGSKNQPLYWLVFAARHQRAHEFWEKIRNISPQRSLL